VVAVTAVRVIGIDPGPTPGIVLLRFNDGPFGVCHVVQCTHLIAPEIFRMLLGIDPVTPTIVGVERFVIGAKSYKTGSPGGVTRDLVGQLIEVFDDHDSTADGRRGGRFFQRNASQVKAWATDERLMKANLYVPTSGMTHARDAARHALFAAVHDGGTPDPLSKRSR
jgi:hypothetical protein